MVIICIFQCLLNLQHRNEENISGMILLPYIILTTFKFPKKNILLYNCTLSGLTETLLL